jgi:hypothetical protein
MLGKFLKGWLRPTVQSSPITSARLRLVSLESREVLAQNI